MRTAPVRTLIWKHQVEGLCPFLLIGVFGIFQFSKIIIIDDGDVALTFIYRFHLCAIIALRAPRKIGNQPGGPSFGFFKTMRCDNRSQKCAIIHMAARAHTDLTRPARICQIFDVLYSANLNTVFCGNDNPRPLGQTKPCIVRATQMGRYVRLHFVRHNRGQKLHVLVDIKPPNIDGQDHICGAVFTLGLQPLCQAFGRINHIGFNTGLFGKSLQEWIDKKRLAVGVDIQFRCADNRGG